MENIIAKSIEDKIFTIRGVQVMLDKDLAELYGVETKRINEQVKRNIERFPEEFCFQLTKEEVEILRSQIATLNDENDNLKSQFATSSDENASLRSQNATLNSENEPSRSQIATLNSDNQFLRSQNVILNSGDRGKHSKYLPYAFTEQGVAMLASILKSETAVKVSIQIMNAFVQMRHFLSANGSLFARLDSVEKRQIETEEKLNRNLVQIHERLDVHEKNFEKVFDALEAADLPKQGVFCDGQIFDSYKFASDLIRKADYEHVGCKCNRIILIELCSRAKDRKGSEAVGAWAPMEAKAGTLDSLVGCQQSQGSADIQSALMCFPRL